MGGKGEPLEIVQEMVYAQTRINIGKWETQNSLGFWYTTYYLILTRRPDQVMINKKKKKKKKKERKKESKERKELAE